jgi:hypothetical protein
LTRAWWVGLALVACSSAPTDVEGETPTPIAPTPLREEVLPDEPPPVRGADGELLESDERVLGLVLPRGLEEVSHLGTVRVYRSDQPMPLVLRYLGTRLITGVVERGVGGRATYRNAIASGIDPATAVRMDVTVSTTSGAATRVEIEELLPEPLAVPTEDEIRARIEAHVRDHPE